MVSEEQRKWLYKEFIEHSFIYGRLLDASLQFQEKNLKFSLVGKTKKEILNMTALDTWNC